MLISTSGRSGSRIRLAFLGISVTLAAIASSSAAVEPAVTPPQSPPSANASAPQAPVAPSSSSMATAPAEPPVQQLAGVVSDAGAMKHLQALQKIADEHGGNRASGTAGYDASVDYVVGVLRGAGFKVSTPTYEADHGWARRARRGPPAQRHRADQHRRLRPRGDDRRPPRFGRGRSGHRRRRLRSSEPAG